MNSDVAKLRGWRWTLRRISRGGPAEAAWRVLHMVAVTRWNHREVPVRVDLSTALRCFATPFDSTDPCNRASVLTALGQADRILAGTITLLGVARQDLDGPDWASDEGSSSAMGKDLDGSEANVSLKHVWELSRLAPVVDLCIAFKVSGDPRYAARAVDLLDSWAAAMRDRSSVLWGSGVEAGLRIIAISQIIGLLTDEPDAMQRLESHEDLRWTIDRHLDRLARFPSRFSSANNHALVEAAGLLVGSVVFAPSGKAGEWQRIGLDRLIKRLDEQLDGAGLTKEKATDYHGFITAVVAMTVAVSDWMAPVAASNEPGQNRPGELWHTLARMHAAGAALVELGSPRFGDGDDSTVFGSDSRPPLVHALDLSCAVLGLPPGDADRESMAARLLRSSATGHAALVHSQTVSPPDDLALATKSWIATLRAGRTIATMRTGSLGYLAVAAHGHADLTSFQLQVEGRPVLVDPGTFCYDSHPAWRRYLRSSAAHNCLVLDGQDQAEYWGPFLWGTAPTAWLTTYQPTAAIPTATASHDGYSAAGYETMRTLAMTDQQLTITDVLGASLRKPPTAGQSVTAAITLTFDPAITVSVQAKPASNGGSTVKADSRTVWFEAAPGWSVEQVTGHPAGPGWYSPSFGVMVPTPALVVRGHMVMDQPASHVLRWE